MAVLTLVCLGQAQFLLQGFSEDAEVILISATFLQIICWNFVPSGLVFTCSGMFQSLGNTWPALLSTATRLLTFIFPAVWLSRQNDFYIEQIWYLSVTTVCIQASVSFYLLRREFKKRLPNEKEDSRTETEAIA